MGNREHPGARYRVRYRVDEEAGYGPIIELPAPEGIGGVGRYVAPRRLGVRVDVKGKEGLAVVGLDMELIGRRYQIVRLEASPRRGRTSAETLPWLEPSGSWVGADDEDGGTDWPDTPLDIEALPRLPLGKLMFDALRGGMMFEKLDERDQVQWVRPAYETSGEGQWLWDVALTYSVAYAVGARPTKTVAERHGISPSAATQRVKQARDAGLLPKTTPGRAS